MKRIDSGLLLKRLSDLRERFGEEYTLARSIEEDEEGKPEWSTDGAYEALKSGQEGDYAILKVSEETDGELKQKVINTARISNEPRKRARSTAIAPQGGPYGKEMAYLSESWQMMVSNYQIETKALREDNAKLREEKAALQELVMTLKAGDSNSELVELGKTALMMWQNNNIKGKLGEIWASIQDDLTEEEKHKMSILLGRGLAQLESKKEDDA